MPTPLYLIDTNVLIHYVRSDEVWDRITADRAILVIEPTPLISIVTSGELRSIAIQNEWGRVKLDRMEFLLGYLDEIPIDTRDMVDAYAMIDSYLMAIGRSMGKNDLWIAATAHLAGAELLTTDLDFDPLHDSFLTRIWIDPS